ncbi:type I-F CRISPR-associated protein Csy3 [Pseudoalteromonas ruthenica]|uniref:CRISPR-associated protein Cas5 n=1 Tax=Pseudoalteromonas ruthenica TaxID=151081 RepID=A0A0F4Q3P8_9GAMM|nr:type I-F CRISPR-associated protein Csy3 [Pseudoalteromonas ruthenica]KJZ00765.1 CRISPR-associated protein Cas5 [Pseudoalteromonas ruthenica]KJZ01182.1 CRISPR-associated protein Cas5 [Pseudoalteromonas ruthenica]TMO85653.1 type I-F CRISPR-associated protein Csy3 [Pseudoalteromonas ruthenica]TMO92422.1 type I-F CRISPR-associated protein Csy3 [Pseudoalteromonas ruthenica]TMO98892.1 type I-F CRISPR-associated protein Csy3 [Pseudoalteromonas ruthenica]
MADVKLKTPSVLAFEAKLIPSDALMFAGNLGADTWLPILVGEKAVRGTISNRLRAATANDPAKLDAEVSKANLQTVDVAALPHNCDTLKLVFTLRILSDLHVPSTCNDPAYQTALGEIVKQYQIDTEFKELSKRYAHNIANGRFLWRNRVGAEQVKVVVSVGENQFSFDSYEFSLKAFDDNEQLNELTQMIQQGLIEQHAFIKVEAYSQLGQGQAVFPSQELVMGGGKGDKSKFLYQLDGQAAMHSQKIGNALRTIDTWHPQADEIGAIAVEPYGSVTNRGAAYRQPKEKTDFYNLLDAWLLKGKAPSMEQQHYVMAMLIRGGVFGE